eukprot:764215-Hanusia_phi.AAC.2
MAMRSSRACQQEGWGRSEKEILDSCCCIASSSFFRSSLCVPLMVPHRHAAPSYQLVLDPALLPPRLFESLQHLIHTTSSDGGVRRGQARRHRVVFGGFASLCPTVIITHQGTFTP